ncbi:hypothetical protein K0H59_19535 [Shewanella sp. FJAT-51649]|uniref:hypothetical protein n=1 Tax=Shewanella sp. FJAT-51649 TaxID=2864210 RepID=UPI001C660855|nr:hypothetical protein [Shewanella sp. FJAT-51649]QYJ71176.1 hypothetical protein K0H59_19535 [Shewanella sp. FJAT-51649]
MNVPFYESYTEENGEFALTMYEFPYVVVITQDCDLEQNKNARQQIEENSPKITNDKHLVSVIVAPLYNFEHLTSGKHLEAIGIETQVLNSSLKRPIKQNSNPRYHYIEFGNDVIIPDSAIDFKHYFSVSLNWLETNMENRICGINPLYRELISQRFTSYLSRIGLPNEESIPSS